LGNPLYPITPHIIDDVTCWYDSIGQYKPKSVSSTLAKTMLGAVFVFKALGNPLIKQFQAQNCGAFEEGLNVNQFKSFFLQTCF